MNKSTLRQEAFFYALISMLLEVTYYLVVFNLLEIDSSTWSFNDVFYAIYLLVMLRLMIAIFMTETIVRYRRSKEAS